MARRLDWLKIIIFLNVVESLNVSLTINQSERIFRKVNEDLNLLCSVALQNGQASQFDMDWSLPKKISTIDHRVSIKTSLNHVLLRMSNLQVDDSGDYMCTASNRELGVTQKNITVIVKPKKGCSEKHFRCSTGHCIPARYVCDGFTDCPSDSSDEAAHKCGPNPCEGKIRCTDGRCLDRHLCCDPYLERNCPTSHVLPCCQRFIHSTYSQVVHPSLEQQRRYDSDLGFLQSTIYTVIGCAVAFVFIVTIMVIAVCRVHLKRSAMTAHPRSRVLSSSSTPAPAPSTWEQQRRVHDTDVLFRDVGDPFLYSAATSTPPGSANVLVAYNINSGIQFVGRLIKPPSYSEIAQELTAPDGPPPPYRSTDDLFQRPLQQQLTPCSIEQLDNANTDTPVISLHRFAGPSYSASLRPNIVVNRLSDSE